MKNVSHTRLIIYYGFDSKTIIKIIQIQIIYIEKKWGFHLTLMEDLK